MARQAHAGALLFGGVAIFGVGALAFGLSRSFLLSLGMLAIMGAADMMSVFVRASVVQLGTPDEMRGRVTAVHSLFVGTANELGDFRAGAAAAWLGAVPAVLAGGARRWWSSRCGPGSSPSCGAWSASPTSRRNNRLGSDACGILHGYPVFAARSSTFQGEVDMPALPAGWKPFCLGALAGAAAISWAGFDAFGWKTSGAVATLGKRQADTAVVLALAHICDARFRKEADFSARLAALEKVERYSRGEVISKAGWATMPGGKEPNQDVGRACAELLIPEKKS